MNRLISNLFKISLIAAVFCFASCGDDEPVKPAYEIPTTYNFENVSYSGQTQRLSQLAEMRSYMATSRTAGNTLDAARLKAMFTNDAATAQWAGNYEASKQLKNKTFEIVRADFEALMDELAAASQSTVPGSNGQSGVVESADGSKKYLLGDDGLDHAQVIEKGLMGACFYYQATTVYLGPDKMNVDNVTVTPGEGTAMEHHWDEAFGYLGVPLDFPVTLDGTFFWGNYSKTTDAVIGSNKRLMDALIRGRAAISANDLETRDEAIREVRAAWELVSVGAALHYLNSGITNFGDMSIMGHGVSEAIGFIYSLQFNDGKKITNEQINELLTLVAGSANFSEMNLYNTTVANLQQAKDKLAGYYGLTADKDKF